MCSLCLGVYDNRRPLHQTAQIVGFPDKDPNKVPPFSESLVSALGITMDFPAPLGPTMHRAVGRSELGTEGTLDGVGGSEMRGIFLGSLFVRETI